jgi:hypothetical protein
VKTYPDAAAHRLRELCDLYLRAPIEMATESDTGAPLATFEPPLSTAEQATFAELATMARFGVSLTLAEWQGIKADAAGLRAYLGVASPTAAQTAAAVKGIVRVLGKIIRE